MTARHISIFSRPLFLLLLLLTLFGCDSGDDGDAPSLAGLWEFVAPVSLPDEPFFVRITADGDGYRSETWTYYEAPAACFFRDQSEDARLEPLGDDRYRVTEGGDVSEVTITVSGDVLTVRNGSFSSQFRRTTRSLTPVCEGEPGGDDGGTWSGTVTATVNDQPFAATEFVTFYSSGSTLGFFASVSAGGVSRYLTVELAGVTGAGTYVLAGEERLGQWVEDDGSTPVFFTTTRTGSDAGAVVLDEFSDQRVRGTFAFTATSESGATRDVAGGTFDLTYVEN